MFSFLVQSCENGKFSKNKTPAPQEKSHLEDVEPVFEVLNKNGPWVPCQEQNVFIFINTTFHEQKYVSFTHAPRVVLGDIVMPH